MEKDKYTVDFIKENGLVLLDVVSGSHAYGTAKENSDLDKRGIYFPFLGDFILGNYPNQIEDEGKDVVYYEIGRYFNLLMKNNPNILELLAIPEDCINYKHPLIDLIKPEDFISKMCKKTLGGYAHEQINKAKGLNKKINQPMSAEKKSILDFCYVIEHGKSYPLKNKLKENKMEQKFCGLVSIPNAENIYALYYDWTAHNLFSSYLSEEQRKRNHSIVQDNGTSKGLGYKGIVKDGEEESTNDLRLSSVPKEEMNNDVFTVYYNKDGYIKYCKQYKEYWDWVKNRNEERYKDNQKHGKGYDSKNMMHCFRLCQMAVEIAKGEGIKVRRPNTEYLMKIREGEIPYEEILNESQNLLQQADDLFDKSNIPDKPNIKKAKEIEIEIRRNLYSI